MRRDRLYLDDIDGAAEAIKRFLANVSEEDFLANDLVQSAVLQKLMIIGEAARISPQLKANTPYIPRSKIAAFRNIAIHAYFSVQWPIVWIAATEEAPLLQTQVLDLLANINDEEETD